MKLLATVGIRGKAVPWSAPFRGTVARRDHTKVRVNFTPGDAPKWKAQVAKAAKLAMADRKPHDGPVMIRMTFVWGTDDKDRWGLPAYVPTNRVLRKQLEAGKGRGDLTNTFKLCEDAAKNVIYPDDRLTVMSSATARWGSGDGVLIEVFAVEDDDYQRRDPFVHVLEAEESMA